MSIHEKKKKWKCHRTRTRISASCSNSWTRTRIGASCSNRRSGYIQIELKHVYLQCECECKKLCILNLFLLNARGNHERSKLMSLNFSGKCAWLFGILFLLWVTSVWIFHSAPCPCDIMLCLRRVAVQSPWQARYLRLIALTNHSMPKRASVPASAPQALGFKCITCDAEFDTPRGAACRRPSSYGTAYADPNSILSVLITPRPDVTAGILRQHFSAPLGTPISVIYCTHPWLPGTTHCQTVDYHLQ